MFYLSPGKLIHDVGCVVSPIRAKAHHTKTHIAKTDSLMHGLSSASATQHFAPNGLASHIETLVETST